MRIIFTVLWASLTRCERNGIAQHNLLHQPQGYCHNEEDPRQSVPCLNCGGSKLGQRKHLVQAGGVTPLKVRHVIILSEQNHSPRLVGVATVEYASARRVITVSCIMLWLNGLICCWVCCLVPPFIVSTGGISRAYQYYHDLILIPSWIWRAVPLFLSAV